MRMNDILDTLWQTHNDPGGDHAAHLADEAVDFDEGQFMQVDLLNRWLAQGEQLGGWKIGMTSGASRNALGEGLRPFGFVLDSRIKLSGDSLELDALCRGQVENELCFLIGAPLGADATREDAVAAVAGIVPAFEINQKRLPGNASAGLRVADNLSNWGIVVGKPVMPNDALDALNVATLADGEIVESVSSADHIDDHFESLATLARRLAAFGQSLEAGQYVITGAYGKTPFAKGHFRGEFSLDIGSVEVRLR